MSSSGAIQQIASQPTASAPQSYSDAHQFLIKAQQAESAGSIKDAIDIYVQFINMSSLNSPEEIKSKEESVVRAAGLLGNDEPALAGLIRALEPAWLLFPRAKTAKIIRGLLDLFSINSSLLAELLNELIEWCVRDRRFYLKQALLIKLASVLFAAEKFTESLDILTGLSRELRKLDDKMSLIEVHLLEAQILFAVRSVPKARAALTTARTCANAVYCPPILLAEMDILSGLLHAEDGDFSTAASYFIEALEGFSLTPSSVSEGGKALRYLLMCKIILGHDLQAVLDSKAVSSHLSANSSWITALQAISVAYREKSLQSFDAVLSEFAPIISTDKAINHHLHNLYETLLEKNLLKIARPYSNVPLSLLAQQLKLSELIIEKKLCQMILDGCLNAVIDQDDQLYLKRTEPSSEDPMYTAAITAIRNMDGIVEALNARARSIQ